MEGRAKRRSKPTPVILQDQKDQNKVILANRAAKKQHAYFQAHSAGQSVRQEQSKKRKDNLVASRRALRKMRNETKAAMRKAAGL